MATLTQRQALLLQLMSEMQRAISGADLAHLLGVSTRTLRYDISRINGLVHSTIIESDPSGYRLNARIYRDVLNNANNIVTAPDNKDRVLVALLNLVDTDIYTLSAVCYMSEGSIRQVVKKLRPRLEVFDIELVTSGFKIRLVGKESAFRRVLAQLISYASANAVGNESRVAMVLSDVDPVAVKGVVSAVLEAHRVVIDDIHLAGLAVNIAIALQRYQYPLESSYSAILAPSGNDSLSSDLLAALRDAFPDRPLGELDARYVRALVRSACVDSVLDEHSSDGGTRLEAIVASALERTAQRFNFDGRNERLLSSLTEHVRRFTARTATFFYSHEIFHDALKTRSAYLYDVAVYFAYLVSESTSIPINDSEIGLLAIYFGLYSDGPSARTETCQVCLVCPNYHSLRDWMLASLARSFGDRLHVVDVVSTNEEASGIDCDLVISTEDRPCAHHTVVTVSAMLTSFDIAMLESGLLEVRKESVRRRLATLLDAYITDETFTVNAQWRSCDEAIEAMAGDLVRSGAVDDDFAASVRAREGFSPTAFAGRFAVPHALEFVARRTALAVAICETPIPWGEAEVSMVLMLAIAESDAADMAVLYQGLVSLIYEPHHFAELLTTSSARDFSSYLLKALPDFM